MSLPAHARACSELRLHRVPVPRGHTGGCLQRAQLRLLGLPVRYACCAILRLLLGTCALQTLSFTPTSEVDCLTTGGMCAQCPCPESSVDGFGLTPAPLVSAVYDNAVRAPRISAGVLTKWAQQPAPAPKQPNVFVRKPKVNRPPQPKRRQLKKRNNTKNKTKFGKRLTAKANNILVRIAQNARRNPAKKIARAAKKAARRVAVRIPPFKGRRFNVTKRGRGKGRRRKSATSELTKVLVRLTPLKNRAVARRLATTVIRAINITHASGVNLTRTFNITRLFRRRGRKGRKIAKKAKKAKKAQVSR